MIFISVLEINLEEIKLNLKNIKKFLNNNQKFCMVVKANAYGLGDKQLCKYFNDYVDYFAVSSENEFLSVFQFATKPILILDPIYKNITKLAKKNAEFTVSNFESLNVILKNARRNQEILFKIHIAINTGMNRFGFYEKNEIEDVIQKLKKVQNIVIIGVFSHFYDQKIQNTIKKQYKKFNDIKNFLIQKLNINDFIFHMCSSLPTIKNNCFDMVRIGIGLYIDESFETIRLVSKIIQIQQIKTGESAGYNKEFIAKKDSKIAVVAIGYADGLFRNIVKNGWVLIKDNFCKIVAICMDSIFVDITNIECNIYDDVVLIGKDSKNQIFICDLAKWCDTISYEILTHISNRVKRKYIRGHNYANYNRKISCEKTYRG